MWRAVLLVGIVLGASQDGFAGKLTEELEPVGDVFGEGPRRYHVAVRAALLAEEGQRRCQMVVLPSFSPEWAVYLRTDMVKNEYGIVYTACEASIWKRLMAEQQCARSNTKRCAALRASWLQTDSMCHVERQTARVSAETVHVLDELWKNMLYRVRYDAGDSAGADGVAYYFSQWVKGSGYLSGKAWFPTPTSRLGRFVAVGERMKAIAVGADTERAVLEESLRISAEELLREVGTCQ
jgi:hypothetical protein